MEEGRRSVGTISANACSYAVRILLSRTEIPAGFLASLSSRATHGQATKKRRRKERDGKGRRGSKGRESNQSYSRHGPPTIFAWQRSYEVVRLENQLLAIFRQATALLQPPTRRRSFTPRLLRVLLSAIERTIHSSREKHGKEMGNRVQEEIHVNPSTS